STHEDRFRHIGQEVLVEQMAMGLLDRLQILLPYAPPVPGAAINLPGPVHGQTSRFVLKDQPLHPVHIWLASAEVLRVAFENRLHVRLVTLQEKGSSTDSALRFLQ